MNRDNVQEEAGGKLSNPPALSLNDGLRAVVKLK